jgi:hypothetical protein
MNRCLKKIPSAKLTGLAPGVLALSPAAQPATVSANPASFL